MVLVADAAGGVARDVLARQRPLVLTGQIYALSAAVGATALAGLTELHAPYEAARWTGVAVTLILRLLAIRYYWSLPSIPSSVPPSGDA